MTDPIKEQAEKALLDKGLNNLVISKGDKKPYVYCSDAMAMFIETHLREKEELRAELDMARNTICVECKPAKEKLVDAQYEMEGLNQTIRTLSSEIYKLRTSSPVYEELVAEQERAEGLEETIDQIIQKNHEQIKDFDIKIKALEARCLELTQALQHITDTANGDRDSFRSCSMICEYVHKQLSSPTSRKYLAMIEVVEAAKELREDNDYENCSNLIKSLRKLESEEA